MKILTNYLLRNLDVFAVCFILESHGQGPFSSVVNFCGFAGYGILRGLSIHFLLNQELEKLKQK